MINVGMVGFGLSGRHLQSPFFLSSPRYKLSKIITSQELPVSIFGNTQRGDSIDELLTDPTLDLISVCSPNPTHFEYTKRALEAGKHVLVEKPLTPTVKQAEELYELAKKVNKTLCVFQNRRFDSDFSTVKKVIESGVLGEILSYEAHFDRYRPQLNPKAWKEVSQEGAGILYDLGAHLVDQAISLFGTPQQVYGEVFTQRDHSNVDDAFNVNMAFGKVRVNLKSSLLVKDPGPKYIIHGTLGSFTKYGMDLQEDHLVKGVFPLNEGFGIEPQAFDGKIVSQIKGLELEGTIKTEKGNWSALFDNLADVITGKAALIIKPEEILQQINILEQIKNG